MTTTNLNAELVNYAIEGLENVSEGTYGCDSTMSYLIPITLLLAIINR